ncbi:lysozyme [Synechococcus phage S-CRES3]|nr:lysozyme [Synechococcus phage S-CRES3]
MPEYILATLTAAVLGWGGFTWRRAEAALIAARMASDATDKLELKLAEQYVTKKELEMTMDRLFKTLGRFEEKLDYHVYAQASEITKLRAKLNIFEKD